MAKPAREVKLSKDDPDRAARLAQALRDNLRRRKAQSREAEAAASPAGGDVGESGDPASPPVSSD